MSACTFCELPATERHHLTGRDNTNRYLDPHLIVPACHHDNLRSVDDWYTLGLMSIEGRPTLFDFFELRFRRSGCEAARINRALGGATPWGPLAEALVRWANEIQRLLRLLDELWPEWREVEEFYPPEGRLG